MLQFCIYGSHPEVTVYSIPVWLAQAQEDSKANLFVHPVARLCGRFENGLIFENFGDSDEKEYFWMKRVRNWSRYYSFKGDLGVNCNIQRVIWRDNALIISSWEG